MVIEFETIFKDKNKTLLGTAALNLFIMYFVDNTARQMHVPKTLLRLVRV